MVVVGEVALTIVICALHMIEEIMNKTINLAYLGK